MRNETEITQRLTELRQQIAMLKTKEKDLAIQGKNRLTKLEIEAKALEWVLVDACDCRDCGGTFKKDL